MAKGEKQWIKPGFLAKQKLIEYEKERNKRIKKNNTKMNALKVNSLVGSTQPNRVNEKGKNIRVEVDDNDYIPLDHHDTDDESFESVEDEVQLFSFWKTWYAIIYCAIWLCGKFRARKACRFKGRFKYLPGQVRAFGMVVGGIGITPMFQSHYSS
ncbi:NADH--cytochrome b5 reductase 1 [Camellia lanceoleosa]|uniref:NADH--cytochrome b5 reductase 1 n=1 Tax=Camellia lanceoleosa TaxID=1840588 RepID=A0ACC0GPR7_9ERIC|nr:NADH--cytochrome b5 reductase 1 [Camellia lanceoleosa]